MRLPELSPVRIGGDVAVDFFNTVGWRLDPTRRNEGLPDYAHVLAWMAQSGLIPASEAEALARTARAQHGRASVEHERILALRDDTYDALVDGRSPERLQRDLVSAHAASRLVRDAGGRWHWSPLTVDLSAPRHLLALEFARLLTSDAIARFHRCEDRFCGWVFLDTSRQHNRRWCSSADCGNRNRVRAHYERAKST